MVSSNSTSSIVASFGLFVVVQENENGFSHRDLIPVVQPPFRHHASVYEGSVTAVEIANLVAILLAAEYAMAPRQGKIADRRASWKDLARCESLLQLRSRSSLPKVLRPPVVLVSPVSYLACGYSFTTISGFREPDPASCSTIRTDRGLSDWIESPCDRRRDRSNVK